jgi:hypothetical protein
MGLDLLELGQLDLGVDWLVDDPANEGVGEGVNEGVNSACSDKARKIIFVNTLWQDSITSHKPNISKYPNVVENVFQYRVIEFKSIVLHL